MNHVVLLGDSIFDNAAYVKNGQDVRSQLQAIFTPDWRVTLVAVDGSTTDNIAAQVKRLPPDATHLILSIGGNDALLQMGLLKTRVQSVFEAVALMTKINADFNQRYAAMLEVLLARKFPLTLCTIYSPHLSNLDQRYTAMTALMLYNDAIIRAAVSHRLPLLDLRFVCTEDADFIHEIEPSAAGGAKIAAAIQRHLTEYNSQATRTMIFT